MKRKLSDIERKILCDMYLKGKKVSYLCSYFKMCASGVHRILNLFDIKKRSRADEIRKFNADFSYFNHIDSEDKAYWLGFIFGDGNVCRNESYCLAIGLSPVDENHLIKFKNCISYTGNIYKYEKVACIKINNKLLYESLAKYNIIPNKTYTVNELPLNNISPDLQRHFMRGYFDADGTFCFHAKRTGVVSILSYSENIINQVKTWMNLNGINGGCISEPRKHNYSIQFSGTPNFCKIYELFFKQANIYLDRKFVKATEINDKITSLIPYYKNKKFVDNIQELIDLYSKNYSLTKLSKIYNVSINTVAGALRRNNILIRGRLEQHSISMDEYFDYKNKKIHI